MAWRIPLSTSGAGKILNLGEADSAFIGESIILGSTADDAIIATGKEQKIIVHGTVVGSTAIRLEDTQGTRITVGESGRLTSTDGHVIVAKGIGIDIFNDGIIENVGLPASAVHYVSNPGNAYMALTNTGVIESHNGITMVGTGGMTLTNSGVIETVNVAYQDLGSFTDTFINTGTVKGHVLLGGGDDLFDSRTGVYGSGYVDGGVGNDRLYVSEGNSLLVGGAGNDILIGGAGADNLAGGLDVDTASYASAGAGVKASLANAAGNTGEAKGDTYNNIERLVGSKFADTLVGNGGANQLTGGAGADSLTGGGGADRFVFNVKPAGSASADHITDFATDLDELRLDDASFAGLALGNFAGGAFWASDAGTAHDGTDRLIYEKDTGWVRFDADGNGAGASVAFVKLAAGLNLGADDFVVF